MKSVTSVEAGSGDERLLAAMNAYINEPAKPTGFTLKESFINLLGGPDDAIDTDYDHRDACEALLELVENNPGALRGRRGLAISFLKNSVSFFNDCIVSDSLRAEIHRDAIEVWGCREMTPAGIENLIKQYELKRQLVLLEAEGSKLANPEKKAA